MLEGITLGIIQGITEWLPISSEGAIVLVKENFFGGGELADAIRFSLFLHVGTFLAALVYLRKDVFSILASLWRFKSVPAKERALINFLFVATVISGALGYVLLSVLSGIEEEFEFSGRTVTASIGVLLLVTAALQLKKKEEVGKKSADLKFVDGIALGLAQGAAVLPGISRSGITISAFLLRGFNDSDALKLSFLLSLPIVLAGNIVLNLGGFTISEEALFGLLFSFIFGLATIHLLLKFAARVNFGYFVLVFGALVIGSVFI